VGEAEPSVSFLPVKFDFETGAFSDYHMKNPNRWECNQE